MLIPSFCSELVLGDNGDKQDEGEDKIGKERWVMRKQYNRWYVWVIFSLILVPVFGFAAKEEVVVIQGAEPDTLDASMERGMIPLNLSIHMLEPLLLRDQQMRLQPLLATSWSYTDNRTLHVQIRQGIKFHDGTPLTAADVKFTFDRIMDKTQKSEQRRYFTDLEKIEAPDDSTVIFHLSRPFAPLVSRLALVTIVPEKVVKQKGNDQFGHAPVGTGPFLFKEWIRGVKVVMEANPQYWRAPSAIKRLTFKFIPEDSTRVAELLVGNADIIVNLPINEVNRVKERKELKVSTAPSLRTMFVLLNTHKPPLNDVRVRKALNYAVDKDVIIQYVLGGYGQKVAGPLGPNVFGYNPNLSPYPYDPERARALLKEAGYATGVSLNLFATSGRYLADREIGQALAGQLAEVGIQVNLQFLEFQAFMQYVRKVNPEVDLLQFTNANNTGDANYNLSLNFYSKSRGLYWNSPDVDALIEKGAETVDQAEREKIYHEALRLIVEEHVPAIFLFNFVDLYGVNAQLKWEARPDEMIYLYGVEFTQ